MVDFSYILTAIGDFLPIVRTVLIISVIFVLFTIFVNSIKKVLLKRTKTKKQKSNVKIFSRIINYSFFVLIVLIAIFSYSGSWSSLGLTVGLLSAAMGWALQKPITGVAAWIMIVTKRPFEIGDRIIIGGVRGDVADITLTHIYLREIGGMATSEESSGRTIMVPNSIMFEQNIINYTLQDDYILDEVVLSVTYESDLDKAKKIGIESAKEILKEFPELKSEPYVRTYFQANGINVHIRYFTHAEKRQETSSKVTQEIFKQISKTKSVEFAYPHTEIVWKQGKK
jgi:small-conductance mechanosensitive channel